MLDALGGDGKLDRLDQRVREFHRLLESNPEGARIFFPVLGSPPLREVLLRHHDEATPAGHLNFASSNYLNLSVRPEVIEAGKEALNRYGSGANGAAVLSGQYEIHHLLEQEIARLHGAESAALFPSGYVANLGVVSSVCAANDFLAIDKKAHASIIDGAKLSRVRLHVFDHDELDKLEDYLRSKLDSGLVTVATETVFSMDGDVCPLPQLVALRQRYGFRLMLDDAHAVGVLGARGRGGLEHHAIVPTSLDFHVGTFSKTFAGIGGYVVGKKDLINFVKFNARSGLFSANIPPAMAACSLAAVRILAEEGETLSAVLRARARFFRRELQRHGVEPIGAEDVPIVPVIVPNERHLIQVSVRLRAQGILANMVRFPAVPRGRSRIRFVLNLGLQEDDLARAAALLAEAIRRAPRP